MLTIIWGHIMSAGITHSIVYGFHIPLFFMLSGMVFSKKHYPNFKDFVIRRVKSLLIPYIIYSVLTWIVWAVFSYFTHNNVDSYIMPLLQTAIAQGSGGFLIHNVPLWFVTCLFMVEMLYYFIAKLPEWLNLMVSVACAFVGCWMMSDHTFFDFRLLPWNIEVALAAVVFYALGNLLIAHVPHVKLINIVSKHKKACLLVITITVALLYIGANYNGPVSMGSTNLGNPLVFYPTAICGTIMMLGICLLLSNSKMNIRNGHIIRYIKWFGKNSFNAMAIHNPIKGFVVVALAYVLHNSVANIGDTYSYSIMAFIITLIITSFGMYLIDRFIKLVRNRQIAGKVQ